MSKDGNFGVPVVANVYSPVALAQHHIQGEYHLWSTIERRCAVVPFVFFGRSVACALHVFQRTVSKGSSIIVVQSVWDVANGFYIVNIAKENTLF